jgi:hypothetical protein
MPLVTVGLEVASSCGQRICPANNMKTQSIERQSDICKPGSAEHKQSGFQIIKQFRFKSICFGTELQTKLTFPPVPPYNSLYKCNTSALQCIRFRPNNQLILSQRPIKLTNAVTHNHTEYHSRTYCTSNCSSPA